jgi:sugar lactone lactonase YvrE
MVRTLSGKGSGDSQFAEALRGIAVDRSGLIYAVGDSEVKVFDAEGHMHKRWSTARPGYCIAVHDNATVYVGQAGQVETFDASGKRLTTWQDADRLGLITSIGFFGEQVLIADAQDRCIRRYDASGQWLNDIGKDNNTKGFLIPNGHLDFVVDSKGIIHASNPAKHRVERYTMSGELLGRFGKFGGKNPEDFPGCCNPTNLTLDAKERLIVTEKAGPRLKVYDSSRKLLAVVDADAFDANCKNMDVAVDAKGNVFVVDTVRLHICVFAPEQAEESWTAGSAGSDAAGVVRP